MKIPQASPLVDVLKRLPLILRKTARMKVQAQKCPYQILMTCNQENAISQGICIEIWEEYVENTNRVEASRERETHPPVSQCLAQFENMIDAQFIFVN